MGFLGFGNYSKPGPGVNKDDLPKPAPIRFFEIFGRKWTKLVQANLIFFVPFLVCSLLSVLIFFFAESHVGLTLPGGGQLNIWAMYVTPFPFVLLSPFYAGLTFISRNFAREEHAFIWSDFVKATKSNFKYFLINGIISYLVYVLLSFALLYYYNLLGTNGFFYIPFGVCMLIGILFAFAQYYVPVMIITFDMKLKQIYRNAFIFAFLGLWRNLLLTGIVVGIFLLFYFDIIPLTILTILIVIVLFAFILFAFFNFLVNFSVYPLIDKYMINPSKKETQGEEAEALPDEEYAPFDDPDDNDDDAFVYINGRLMKKADAEKVKDIQK